MKLTQGIMRPLSDREIDAIVRGYTDAQLAENYQHAAQRPATEWYRLLSAEIGRRDALGPREEQGQ